MLTKERAAHFVREVGRVCRSLGVRIDSMQVADCDDRKKIAASLESVERSITGELPTEAEAATKAPRRRKKQK